MTDQDHDPFAPPAASPRFATPLAVVGMVLGLLAAISGWAAVAGPAGMAFGLVAHTKGSRLGMPATVVSAVGLLVGLTVMMYVR